MKKLKINFINIKNRFLDSFKANKFKTILETLIIVVYFAFALLLPSTSYTRFHLIPFFTVGVMVVLILIWLVAYGKLYLDFPTAMMFLFLVFNIFSWAINGFRYFNQTIVILPIMFLFLYQYLKNTKTVKIFAYLTFLGYLSFAIVFSLYYGRGLVDFILGKTGGEVRLGDAFGNVNGIGGFFAIGFAFSLYYAVIKKRYYNLIFSVLLLFLSATTGSKTAILLVIVSLIATVIVKFGLKKWYITISIIAGFFVILAVVLNIPAFSFLQERIMKMFKVLIGTSGSQTDGSTVSRLNMAIEGLYGFFQKPIFGWGHNGFNKAITSYNSYAHNNYVEILSDYGLVGLLTFESFIFVPMFQYFTRRKLIEGERQGEAKNLTSLMAIFSLFIFFVQFTGVESISKEYYVLLSFLAVISTDYYEKRCKNTVYIPQMTRNLFSKINFLGISETQIDETERQITSIKDLFASFKKVFSNGKAYFWQTMNSIWDKENKVLVLAKRTKTEKKDKKKVLESAIPIVRMNKKSKVLNSAFIVFLSLQGTLAFSFSFYNSKSQLLNSAIEIANKQQIANLDPYVSFVDIKVREGYPAALLKQNATKEDFPTLNPYLQFDARSFRYNDQSFNLKGVTAKDLNSVGATLKSIDLPIVFKEYNLEPLNGADYATMITSRTASSLLGKGATNFSSLIGKTFVDEQSNTYSVNNIIYNDDIVIPASSNTNSYKTELTKLSNHLTSLHNDYILYITAPSNYVSTYKYSFAYFPSGTELIDFIDKTYENYGIDAKLEDVLEFFVLDENGQYNISENYSNINAVYITYGRDTSQIYQILLTIISVILYIITFAITFDISKKYKENKFLYIAFATSLFVGFLPLILIRVLSVQLQIHVLANNAAFIYLLATIATLTIMLLVQNIIERIKSKKNKQD